MDKYQKSFQDVIESRNYNTELSVLSTLFRSPDVVKESESLFFLTPKHFQDPNNSLMFALYLECSVNGVCAGVGYAEDRINNRDIDSLKNAPDGFALIFREMLKTPTTSLLDVCINLLHETMLQKEMAYFTHNVFKKCTHSGRKDIPNLLESLREKLDEILTNIHLKKPVCCSQVASEVLESMYASWRGEQEMGIETPFEKLNQYLGGLKNGTLLTLAANSGFGKSAWAVNLVDDICFNQKKDVLFFNLEMPNSVIMERLIALRGDINTLDIHNPPAGLQETIEQAAVEVHNTCIENKTLKFISDPCTVSDITTISRREKKINPNLKCIVVDHLHHITYKGDATENAYLTHMMHQLKNLATELNIPLVLLSQLNRNNGFNADVDLTINDLRGSGMIASLSDNVVFLQPHEKKEERENGYRYFNIAKCRNGRSGKILAHFNPKRQKWEEVKKYRFDD